MLLSQAHALMEVVAERKAQTTLLDTLSQTSDHLFGGSQSYRVLAQPLTQKVHNPREQRPVFSMAQRVNLGEVDPPNSELLEVESHTGQEEGHGGIPGQIELPLTGPALHPIQTIAPAGIRYLSRTEVPLQHHLQSQS